MSGSYHSLAFTRGVLDAQAKYGSRAAQHRLDRHLGTRPGPSQSAPGDEVEGGDASTARDPLTGSERAFLAERDGFYLATVSETRWPYVQFRGGPTGFVRTPDEHTIAWADFRGNRQYISTGYLTSDNRIALFFMDYARQLRLKVFGRARVRELDLSLSAADPSPLAVPGYRARVEREISVDVAAYDWNCPQHITPRYTVEELTLVLQPLQERVAYLERENARLRPSLGHEERTATDQVRDREGE